MPPDAYGTTARWYDIATATLLRSVRERLLDRIAHSGARTVLDIGCGTGQFAAMLLQRGLDVTGVDVSPAMLAEAAKHVPQERLVLTHGLPLPFESAPKAATGCLAERSKAGFARRSDVFFDASVLCLVMHESSSGAADLLAEALRVAPRCFVVEWRMPERNLDYIARPLVHCIERLAGKEHYASFRRFAENGYLHGTARKLNARVEHEEMMKAGTLLLAEVAG